MEGKRITVVARFKAREGTEMNLEEELLKLVAPSRSDPGCINYDLHRSLGDPSVFIFYENWQSRELLENHSTTPHVKNFRIRVNEMLAEAPEIFLLEMIS